MNVKCMQIQCKHATIVTVGRIRIRILFNPASDAFKTEVEILGIKFVSICMYKNFAARHLLLTLKKKKMLRKKYLLETSHFIFSYFL